MRSRKLHLLFLFLACLFIRSVSAQEEITRSWETEKIKGVRNLPYPAYSGFPFLTDAWVRGKIEFADGQIVDSLDLRYSSFKDELIYFNGTIGVQIVIDKATLKGFSIVEPNGKIRTFRKQYFDNYLKSDRFFEVLSDGKTDVLAFRKVSLIGTTPYKDNSGILKNMQYETEYQYYLYSPEQGYTSIRINQGSLLAKFGKTLQKPIKKMLRKNRIRIADEESFVSAWKLVENEGYVVQF